MHIMARDNATPAVLVLRSGHVQLVRDWRAVGCEIEVTSLEGVLSKMPGFEVDLDATLNETERANARKKTGRVPATAR